MHSKENEIIKLYTTGLSATKVALDLGLHTTSVTRVLKRNGLKIKSGKGEEHSQWKGGRGLKSGYMTVYAPDHPRALNNGRVWEHIIIAENKLKRKISKDEPIHHIDLDRLNNRPSNLTVLKSNSQHQRLHASLNSVVSELIKNKTIKFRNGKYTL